MAIIQSKDWIRWEGRSNNNNSTNSPFAVGDKLRFEVTITEQRLNDGTLSVTANGTIAKQTKPIDSVPLATIAYHSDGVKGNKIVSFLQRFGKPSEIAVFFPNGGYHIMANPDVVRSPNENNTYAVASRDFNPIHTNNYLSVLAKLPTTITHGMWTSAVARR